VGLKGKSTEKMELAHRILALLTTEVVYLSIIAFS
jgi:hypothetical protein